MHKTKQSKITKKIHTCAETHTLTNIKKKKGEAIARANPRYVVPQAFVDSKQRIHRLELLLPLPIRYSNITFTFALALQPDSGTYQGMSILTSEMAYANARLVSAIDSKWLCSFMNEDSNNVNVPTATTATTGVVQPSMHAHPTHSTHANTGNPNLSHLNTVGGSVAVANHHQPHTVTTHPGVTHSYNHPNTYHTHANHMPTHIQPPTHHQTHLTHSHTQHTSMGISHGYDAMQQPVLCVCVFVCFFFFLCVSKEKQKC